MVTTVSFDIAALELYLPLMVGARIELVSRATAADGPALAQLPIASGLLGAAGDARYLADALGGRLVRAAGFSRAGRGGAAAARSCRYDGDPG